MNKNKKLVEHFSMIAHDSVSEAEEVYDTLSKELKDIRLVREFFMLELKKSIEQMDEYFNALRKKEALAFEKLTFIKGFAVIGMAGVKLFIGNEYTISQIANLMTNTFRSKNSDYGDSYFQLYKKYGAIAPAIPIENKCARLLSLLKGKNVEVKEESIADSFLDLACYSVMYAMTVFPYEAVMESRNQKSS